MYDFPISCQHNNLLVLHSKAAAVADQTLLKNDTDVLESVASRSRIYIEHSMESTIESSLCTVHYIGLNVSECKGGPITVYYISLTARGGQSKQTVCS